MGRAAILSSGAIANVFPYASKHDARALEDGIRYCTVSDVLCTRITPPFDDLRARRMTDDRGGIRNPITEMESGCLACPILRGFFAEEVGDDPATELEEAEEVAAVASDE